MSAVVEQALTEVGYGRWQVSIVVLTVLVHMLAPVHLIGSTLLNAEPDFRCVGPVAAATQDHLQESHLQESHLQDVHVGVTSTQGASRCNDTTCDTHDVYDRQCVAPRDTHLSGPQDQVNGPRDPHLDAHLGSPSCPQPEFDDVVFTSTVTTEWALVCERQDLRPLYQMLYSVGSMLGSTIGGHVGDRYGRKRAVQVASVVQVVAIVAMCTVTPYPALLLARILCGFSIGAMIMPVFGLALETTPSRHRTVAGMLLGTSFSVMVVGFAGIGYLLRAWRPLLLAGCAPIVLIMPLACMVGESPRWLAQRGRGHEVAAMMCRAASINKVTLSPDLTTALKQLPQEKVGGDGGGGGGWRQEVKQGLGYLRSPALRRIFLATTGLWFAEGVLYLGILLNANNFTSNDPHVYVAVSGVMDLVAILIATPINVRMGRRVIVGGSNLTAGLLLLADLGVPQGHWLRWVLVMTSLLLVAASFQVNFMWVPELYPTAIRSRGFALASLAGSLGFLAAPLITDVLAQRAWWAVGVSLGATGVFASLLVPLLPETNNKPLPDTIEDLEQRLYPDRRGGRRKEERQCDTEARTEGKNGRSGVKEERCEGNDEGDQGCVELDEGIPEVEKGLLGEEGREEHIVIMEGARELDLGQL